MKTIRPSIEQTILYYTPLLEHYARRLINDEREALILVNRVLENRYMVDGLVPSVNLREVLKFDLYLRCFYFNKSKIFDRPPVGIPLRRKIDKKKFPINFDNQKKV
jgi:hypothetical protein